MRWWFWKNIVEGQEGYGTVEMLVLISAVITIGMSVSGKLTELLRIINNTATERITSLHGSGY